MAPKKAAKLPRPQQRSIRIEICCLERKEGSHQPHCANQALHSKEGPSPVRQRQRRQQLHHQGSFQDPPSCGLPHSSTTDRTVKGTMTNFRPRSTLWDQQTLYDIKIVCSLFLKHITLKAQNIIITKPFEKAEKTITHTVPILTQHYQHFVVFILTSNYSPCTFSFYIFYPCNQYMFFRAYFEASILLYTKDEIVMFF